MFSTCSHESVILNDLPEVSFSKEILPVFQTGCAISGCHDEATAEKGKIYTNYQNILKSVEPEDPDNSKVYKVITSKYELMPPDKPLSIEDRMKIRTWILQGAKNN